MAELLSPMEPYFTSMANAQAMAFGPEVVAPPLSAHVTLSGMDVLNTEDPFSRQDLCR